MKRVASILCQPRATSLPQIALPIRSKALIVETAERIRSDLQSLQQEPEQKRTDADPRHTKPGELTQRHASRTIQDIRRAQRDVLPYSRYVRQEDRIDAISTSIEVLPGTLQALLGGAFVKMHVDAGIDYRVEATGARSCADRGDTLGVPIGVGKSANPMVSVFQVGPTDARIGKAIDEFLR